MSAAPVAVNHTVKNAVNNDDPTAPVLTVYVDTSTTLNGVKMARTHPVTIANPTADQVAAYKAGAAVTLTLAPAATA